MILPKLININERVIDDLKGRLLKMGENKIIIFTIYEAFENHKVEIDYGNEGFSYFGRIEYIINGKRGYFLSNEDEDEYYRIGGDTTIIKTTKNDKVEIFNKCKMRK